mgnify:CR=1 FL=1
MARKEDEVGTVTLALTDALRLLMHTDWLIAQCTVHSLCLSGQPH